MINHIESTSIVGVKQTHFQVFGDERGQFMETFRTEWFPERNWHVVQSNRSISSAGVLRGLHYHHHQVDYWQLLSGKMRVGLADLRRSAPTYLATEIVELDADAPSGLFIPVGVAHGFYAITNCTLLYFVDNYYDGSDEHGVAWNDPQLNLPWELNSPLLSDRDQNNPKLAEIPSQQLPD